MILAILLLFLLPHETQGSQCACGTDTVHVRNGPGQTNAILGTYAVGECHPDKGGRHVDGGYTWVNIDYNGKDGWAADKYLHFQACPSASTGTQVSGACPHIISRAEWGARAPTHPLQTLPALPHYVFIHHGASGSCHTKADCTAMAKTYQNYHMDGRGYSDVGYNFLVGEDGNVYEARGWDKVGGHTLHYNSVGIAICVMGNFMDHPPNDAALNVIKNLINCGLSTHRLPANFVLKGHRDVGQTACPGQKLYDIIQTCPHYQHN